MDEIKFQISMRFQIHLITLCGEWQQRWPNLSRWVLVKAPIEPWLALAIDFPWTAEASLKMAVCCAQHCGKAIKLKSFLLLQILRLTNNSSFLAPINMTQTSSLLHRNIFSLQRWLEWTPVFQRSTHTDYENVNQFRWMAHGLFSRPVTSNSGCGAVDRVSLQEALENGSALPVRLEESNPSEQTWSGAYLNYHLLFVEVGPVVILMHI